MKQKFIIISFFIFRIVLHYGNAFSQSGNLILNGGFEKWSSNKKYCFFECVENWYPSKTFGTNSPDYFNRSLIKFPINTSLSCKECPVFYGCQCPKEGNGFVYIATDKSFSECIETKILRSLKKKTLLQN